MTHTNTLSNLRVISFNHLLLQFFTVVGFTVWLMMLLPSPAQGQLRNPRTPLATQEHATPLSTRDVTAIQAKQIGIRRGIWSFLPSIESDISINDNIYASAQNETSDIVTTLRPSLSAIAETASRSVTLGIESEHNFYADNTDEDHNNLKLSAGMTQTIRNSLEVETVFRHSYMHEPRSSEAAVSSQVETVPYTLTEFLIRSIYQPAKFGLKGEMSWQRYQYDNIGATNGGLIVQDDRDQDKLHLSAEGYYRLSRHISAFVYGAHNTISYDKRDFDAGSQQYNGDKRDSTGYEIRTGMRFSMTNLLHAEIGVGYLEQSYDDASLGNIDGLAYKGALSWEMTPLTTLTASLQRAVRETISSGSAGYMEDSYQLTLKHALRRNLLLTAEASLTENSYEGITRDDSLYRFSLHSWYDINERLGIGVAYHYDERDSSINTANYTNNIFMLNLRWQW